MQHHFLHEFLFDLSQQHLQTTEKIYYTPHTDRKYGFAIGRMALEPDGVDFSHYLTSQ